MIGVLYYRGGNARNVLWALQRLQIPGRKVERPHDLHHLAGLILPGVGAAPAAMNELARVELLSPLKEWTQPFLGICLGMQLLFESSEEGNTRCLGLLPGTVKALPPGVVCPHMGWNRLSNGRYAYFVHSYVCHPADSGLITTTTRYGGELCAGVRHEHLFGVQWHPEKSGEAGDLLLKGFAQLCS